MSRRAFVQTMVGLGVGAPLAHDAFVAAGLGPAPAHAQDAWSPTRRGGDGQPFTAADVVFNWEYAADPATAAASLGTWERVERIERVDSHAVRVVFKRPTPFWAQLGAALLIPRHVFQVWKGGKAREAPAN